MTIRSALTGAGCLAAAFLPASHAEIVTAWFGTVSGEGGSEGIYRSLLNTETGELSDPELATRMADPNFLEVSKDGKFLYAAGRGAEDGVVSAFAIGERGSLTLLNTQPSAGKGPCHVSIDPSGRVVLVANYSSGNAAALPIAADGSLEPPSSIVQGEGHGPNEARQKGPHAHSINSSPDGRFVFLADLGIDKILVYRLDAKAGSLTPNDPPFFAVAPGSGPRHFVFHPDGKFAYVINELANTITAMRYDARAGSFTGIQTITTLPEDFEGKNTTAEVRVHPSGRFVYGSNRGHNSIAVYAVDQKKGTLKLVEIEPSGGEIPRNFNIAPGGRYLLAANQNTHNISVFAIDRETGALKATGRNISIGNPLCIRFSKP